MRNSKPYKTAPMVSRASKVMYASGDLGFSMITSTVSSFLMFFGTSVCGVAGTLMGIAIALGTVWDAVTDPIVGYLSDRKNSLLFGRRHGFLLIAIFGLSVVNVLLWSVPLDASNFIKFLYFLVCLIAFQLFSTFYATPHSALSLELSKDYKERTSIASLKSVFLLIGSILPTLIMALLQSGTGQTAESYRAMAYISSSVMLLLGVVCFLGSYSHIPRLRAQYKDKVLPKQSFVEIFKNFFIVFKKPVYRNLILGYSVSLMSAAFLTSAGFHMFTYTFKLQSTQMYLLMAAVFVMTIASQPFWIWFIGKFDKKSAVLLGIAFVGFGVIYLLVVFLLRETITNLTLVIFPALAMAGLGMGALYTMPTAMLGDTTDIEKQKTNQDKTATYAGFMTFCNKLCNAATLLIVGILLDVIGFDEATALENQGVQLGLGLIVIIGILSALSVGFYFFSKYNVKKADVVKLTPINDPSKKGIVRIDGKGSRKSKKR